MILLADQEVAPGVGEGLISGVPKEVEAVWALVEEAVEAGAAISSVTKILQSS